MVTHNPDLAEQYATRIINLKDGCIVSDSDPFDPEQDEAAVHKNFGRASMSYLTALSLSFNNLRTKLTRTLLIAAAGSIGIIGIALIMALSNGVNLYIKNVEEETLKEYPLTINSFAFDLSALMGDRSNSDKEEEDPDSGNSKESQETKDPKEQTPKENREVTEQPMAQILLSTLTTNDLASLKTFLDDESSGVQKASNAVEYSYNVTPLIYRETDEGYRQINPDTLMSSLGYNTSGGMASMFSSFSSTDIFHAMPENEDLFKTQYEIKAGKWPENSHELLLVLTQNGFTSDIVLYDLGLKDTTMLDEMIRRFLAGDSYHEKAVRNQYKYEDFIGRTYKLVSPASFYTYDETYELWTDKTQDQAFMKELVHNGDDLVITGVAVPLEDAKSAMLSPGVNYPASLTYYCMEQAADSEIVKDQLKRDTIDVISNRAFGDPDKNTLDMESLFTVDEKALEDLFKFDTDVSSLDFSSVEESLDFSNIMTDQDFHIDIPGMDFNSMLNSINIQVSPDSLRNLFSSLMEAYTAYSESDPSTSWSKLPEAFGDYLQDEETQETFRTEVRALASDLVESAVTEEDLQAFAQELISGYEEYRKEQDLGEDDDPQPVIAAYLEQEEVITMIRDFLQGIFTRVSESETVPEDMQKITDLIVNGYDEYAKENDAPMLSKLQESFETFLNTEQAASLIRGAAAGAVDTSGLQNTLNASFGTFAAQLSEQITQGMTGVVNKISEQLTTAMPQAMESVLKQIQDSFSFDPESFRDIVQVNFNEDELRELMNSLIGSASTSLKSNLSRFGYVTKDDPSSISIYPKDFESKNTIKGILDGYNERLEEAGDTKKMISYTDLVGTMMSSVTDIVNAISYVLIAFVAISLIVSSIMIGVITYISVLERKKEIGVLRAIGASKRNISQVFNAETIIIGALAGLLGVGVTQLILIPANIILRNVTGQDIRAVLPLVSGALLILLSTLLTMMGGFIPSKKASRSDPVTALRTE
ncbi:MAG: FtsX-like permease family protein, partial [Lachnospiraceae bacterium]|nr:FtsX-like permease family protein [Lachnospiraceae bacterium]